MPAPDVRPTARALTPGCASSPRAGRKPTLAAHQRQEAIKRRDAGKPVREIALDFNMHNTAISRLAA